MLNTLMKCQTSKLLSSLIKKKPIYLFSKDHKIVEHSHENGHKEVNPYQQVHRDNQPFKIILRDEKLGYYLDPNEVARRMIRLIAQFDKVKDPQKLTLSTQWHEMGLNQLDTVQLLFGIEDQFSIEFPNEVAEKFKDIHDAVQYVSRSFWAE